MITRKWSTKLIDSPEDDEFLTDDDKTKGEERTCIVTRQKLSKDEMIRFVLGPDNNPVPDLKCNLPGRGCWTIANRQYVDDAVNKGLFNRAFKTKVDTPKNLGEIVDMLLVKSVLGSLGLARKAGALVTGATKCDLSVRSGKAICLIHALEASEDGSRKLDSARRAVVHVGGPSIPAYKLFAQSDLEMALGGENVMHVSVLAQKAGIAARKRVMKLEQYRSMTKECHGDGVRAVKGIK